MYYNSMNMLKKLFLISFLAVMLTNCSAFNIGLSGATFTGNDYIKMANAVKNAKLLTNEGVKEEIITETKNVLRSINNGGSFQR